jgi:uncharacterized protein YukJ
MPLPNYSLLKGDPVSGRVQFNAAGKNPHFHIKANAGDSSFDIAVNIQSDDASEVLYTVDHAFQPALPDQLLKLDMGVLALDSKPGGLALDYVRETIGGSPMVDRNLMSKLPISTPAGHRHNDLHNEVVDLLTRAVQDKDGTIYAFGDTFPVGGDPAGIHDIHMNQGNTDDSGHERDNGAWQDGAVFVNLPAQNVWIAVFIAFQTQVWNTDDNGDPS